MKNELDFIGLCERISVQVGPPTFTAGEKQKPELNQQFFARFAAAVYKPIFEKTEGVFYLYVPETGLWVRHDEAAMIDLICLLMKRFADETEDSCNAPHLSRVALRKSGKKVCFRGLRESVMPS